MPLPDEANTRGVEAEQGGVDPVWAATVRAKGALSLAMVRLGGEGPAQVYDEKGYIIWVEAVTKEILKPFHQLLDAEVLKRQEAERELVVSKEAERKLWRSEVQKLRAALEQIATYSNGWAVGNEPAIKRIAAAALGREGEG